MDTIKTAGGIGTRNPLRIRRARVSKDFGLARQDSPSKLIAGVLHGAVDIRIHAHVVEGTGNDRHRDRTGLATTDRTFVITALSSGDTADDQPDDKK